MVPEGPTKLYAFLTVDEGPFLRRHYPDAPPPEPVDGYAPPRDAATVTIPEVANILDMTRSGAWRLCMRGTFESLRKVGPPDSPIYLLDVREVLRYAEERNGPA